MSVTAISSSLAYQRPSSTGKSADVVAPESGGDQATGDQTQASGAYISPVLRYDQNARVAVLYFRDFDTGETRDQIPAEQVVKKYRQSGGRATETESKTDTETPSTTTQNPPATRGVTGSAPTTSVAPPTYSSVPSAPTVSTGPTTGGSTGSTSSFSSVSISV